MLPRLKRILIGVAIGSGAFAAGIWVLIHTLGDHDDEAYRGKPLSYWLAQAESREAAVSNQARVVLEADVIPQLIVKMFCDTNDSSLRLALIDRLNNLPGVQIIFTPTEARRMRAVSSLGDMGPLGAPAIPDLIKALKSNDGVVAGSAARSLGRIHCEPEKIIPLLIAGLDSPVDGVREGAAQGLGEFGPLSKAALPRLLELSKIPDKDLRVAVGSALKKIDPESAAKAGAR